jgi:eukaryotic-like serine/threonine-protein kinase
MADEPRVQQLLDELIDSQRTPEEVCGACPELVPEVRRRWQQMRVVDAELNALFPTQGPKSDVNTADLWYSGADLPRIPGYEVEAVLGHGGMGIVYKVRDLRLHRCVALKMLLAGAYAGAEEKGRFSREAEALARLRHANIVQVHDVGDLDGRPYFMMEFVEGGSLSQHLAGMPQPARAAAALVATLAEAVQMAHQSGIVHRDLKPANILLTADGTPKITDFGLARPMEGGSGLTLSGIPMGTPSYMAPEQAQGQRDAIGPATDVYALGGILYEMLTGRPPFRAETAAATLQQMLAEEPLPPSRLNSRVPHDLETICLKCLRKEPQQRYASAAELAEDLRRFAAGEPIRARPVGRLGRTIKWVRRRPTAAALIAVTLLLVAAGIGATVWYLRDRGERRVDEALRGQQINRDADIALTEAESHLQDIRAKLEDPLKVGELLSDIELWQTTVEKSRRAWERAQMACAGNDRFVPPSMLSRLRTVENTLLSEENAYRLAKELDDIKSDALTPIDGKFQFHKAKPAYAAFFTRQGLDVAQGDMAQLRAALNKSSIRLVLAAALDHWAEVTANANSRDQQLARLLELARAADPDPWRDRFRDPAVWRDRVALTRLADDVKVEQQTPTILAALANRLARTGGKTLPIFSTLGLLGSPYGQGPLLAASTLFPRNAGANASTIYHRALLSHPRDFWLHWNAAYQAEEPAEQVGLYLATLVVRPGSAVAYTNLGAVFRKQKDLTGAIATCNRAIEINPQYGPAYVNLGAVLWDKKDQAGAIAAFKKAIEVAPKIVEAHDNLGLALLARKDQAGAIAAFKKAIEVDPQYAQAYVDLGAVLCDKEDLPGAIAAFKKAIEVDPNLVLAYNNLGVVLRKQQDLPGAIAAYKKATELAPNDAHAYNDLGCALYSQKDFAGAGAAFKKALDTNPKDVGFRDNLCLAYHDSSEALLVKGQLREARAAALEWLKLLPTGHPDRKPAQQLLERCDQLLVLDQELSDIMQGKEPPHDAAELLALADLCLRNKHYYAAAARFYAAALEKEPKLAEDVRANVYYDAACAASLASVGKGKDGDKLQGQDRNNLRRQALDWFQANLALRRKQSQSGNVEEVVLVTDQLAHAQSNPDLAGVREARELAGLAKKERESWQLFWTNQAQLLKETRARFTLTQHKGSLTARITEQIHEVKMLAGKSYVLDLESSQFDAFLRLEDAKGKVLAENDDISLENFNSRVIFTPRQTGIYRIIATSSQHQGTGAYALTIRELAGP